jgi:hypothetical protein
VATRTKKKRSRPADDEEEVPRRRKKGSSSGGSGGLVKLDLRKTERGKKGGARFPEGEYKWKITKAERKASNNGNTQIVMTCEILAPEKYAGKTFIDRLTLTEPAMYRVGWLLDAVGIKWKNAIVSFPLKKLVGKVLGGLLHDDEFGGRVSSKVSEYYSEEEVDEYLDEDEDDEDEDDEDDEEDDDEDEDEDDEEDEDEEDEYDELSLVKLKKEAKKRGIKAKKAWDEDDYREALREDDEEDDDEDEDLDELDDEDL